MADPPKRYLLHVRVGQGQPERSRIASVARGVQVIVQAISKGEFQLAYTSQDAGSFGFFCKTALNAAQIRGRLEYGDRSSGETSPITNDDSLLILELGEDFSGLGFSKAWTWLQHH